MQVISLNILDLVLVTPGRFSDARGWFSETWNKAALAKAGLEWPEFIQDNHSYSAPRHTLRGLHFQGPPHAQDKLVRCSRGAILDVAVDVRRGSPSFGEYVAVELSAENGSQLFVPKGFLHGFLTLTEECDVQYKCSDHYAPDCDGAVRWDTLGIDWGTDAPILSEKDANAIPFSEFVSPFEYQEPGA
ncbi:MAG: dTDP-4-dehydrorhamnose 3,5-epimerase [Rhodobacteraceae bacterium]|nr:MAG: dTDP-4-dehydrorhamnose 3,5-epimerase [Paracoccaceae bacterium]